VPTHDHPWPYPLWIAHRGAGQLAPENTLAAVQLGAEYGYRMFECDVKLSADGVPFLLHDDTLERTTNGHGVAGEWRWQDLARLDAGGWQSPRYAGEPIASLEAVARCCSTQGLTLNIELKPTPGLERHTGEQVAEHVLRWWKDAAVPPLLSSFQVAALEGAAHSAPELPRALLLDALSPGWIAQAQALGCVAVVLHHPLWTTDGAAQARAASLRLLAYTVNDAPEVQRLIALGIDSIITDRVDLFSPT